MAKHGIDYVDPLEQAGLRGKRPRGKAFGGPKIAKRVAVVAESPHRSHGIRGLQDRPRFWYPADLNIPDVVVHQAGADAAASGTSERKPVQITRKKRRRVNVGSLD